MRYSTHSRQTASLGALAAALFVTALVPAAAQAQDSVAEEAEASAGDDQIVVTGSRIARDPNATAPLPVSTLDAEDFQNFGGTDVTAALRQIPALISSGTVADSLERGGGGVGQATLNLRQLGSNRTLVLVDGWRHVSGVAG
jgi:outer membrane cobalamin receptor